MFRKKAFLVKMVDDPNTIDRNDSDTPQIDHAAIARDILKVGGQMFVSAVVITYAAKTVEQVVVHTAKTLIK